MLKRGCDVIISILLIGLLAPTFALIALAVKLSSPGPVLHRAERVGRDFRPFEMYKFRTMVPNAANAGPGITRAGDRRVTPVGKFLRRHKLDELPQLFNVLKGDMSLVGPRPEDVRYALMYTARQRRVLAVRPGMASPASLKYCNEEEVLAAIGGDLETAYLSVVLPDKLEMDLAYVDNRSAMLDLGVLALVGFTLFPTAEVSKHGITYSTISRLLPRYAQWMIVDGLIALVAMGLAWATRFALTEQLVIPDARALVFALVTAALVAGINNLFRLHERFWGYASAHEVIPTAAAVGVSTMMMILIDAPWPGERPVPIGIPPIAGVYLLFGSVAVRYRSRLWTGLRWRLRALQGDFPVHRTRTLIVGAGESGQLLARRLLTQREGSHYHLVGYVDDDPGKQGMQIHGRPVLGNRDAIPFLVTEHDVDLIILALYNLGDEAFQQILGICEPTSAAIKILPNVFEFFKGVNGVFPLRDVRPEDLIGRKAADTDTAACSRLVGGKTVLVTGAAGSIGSELCRQLASLGPSHLVITDNNESGLYDLSLELRACGLEEGGVIVPVMADVTHKARVDRIFAAHHPEVVFHAAAYKHVPLMEDFPEEAVRANVLGTKVVAQAAENHGAERFVLVSTDKAINPSSVMGATKRVAELIVEGLATRDRRSATLFTAVRFGNVLGSRGSVVPTFERQIDQGGPVTVTHPEMTRYFMTIPEAVSLIIQAATQTNGNDIYMLNMGQEVSIEALARRLIRLHGLRPDVDIPIIYTGVRPGEKIREDLLGSEEERRPTAHPNIFQITASGELDWGLLQFQVERLLSAAAHGEKVKLEEILCHLAGLCREGDAGMADIPIQSLTVIEQIPMAVSARPAASPRPTAP